MVNQHLRFVNGALLALFTLTIHYSSFVIHYLTLISAAPCLGTAAVYFS
ncbi:hypothetical protein SBA2_270080 [Acidobacteriia bacterium SbA2]|nr:hypothetical protein SBA2_270080 [Acidobacteriia bacterium SbA2]